MSDIFKKRMALCGNTVSDSIRTQSDEIMQKTFTNDNVSYILGLWNT